MNTDNNDNNTTTDNTPHNDNTDNKENTMQDDNKAPITYTFTKEQHAQIMELLEFGQKHPDTGLTTIGAIVERVAQRGIYDVNYRTRRNVREYNSYKAWKKATT